MIKQKNYFNYNLQFFAKDGPGGEKTEPATSKKLDDARGEGQVSKSKEITSAIMLIVIFIVLQNMVGSFGDQFMDTFAAVYNKIPDIIIESANGASSAMVRSMLNTMIIRMILIMLPVLMIGFGIAFIVDLYQVKWKVTGKPLKPKFNKLNPLSGFKRIFSAQSIFELVKSVGKVLIIVWIAYSAIKDQFGLLMLLYDMPLLQGIQIIGDLVLGVGLQISAVYLIIALADVVYQKIKFKNDMKMTKQEVKDEYKNSEGNPEIKGKIRNKMREASQRRMMQTMPTADVVITNPTHFAVALKYDADSGRAPIVLAKGEDFLAQRIKDQAKNFNIEIVENKPLARMLYFNVEVGMEIPPELYQAVAEVLAFVYNLKNKL